ncbi:MAG: hypothetical protein IPO00_02530 [Betaproteobacteria bacterium]|nr:hypothetical protein [Betaproteobacteria bacterium]
MFVAVLFLTSHSFADDGLPAADRLKSCDPGVALAAAKEVLSDPKTLKEPLEMFSPAFVLFQNDKKDEAVFWFYAAQLRVRYQLVFEKGDRGQLLSIMLMTVGLPINNYAFQDVRKLNQVIDRVLEWDTAAPNPFREKPRSREVEASLEKVYSGIRDLKEKLSTERVDDEQKAKSEAQQMEQMAAQLKPRPCQPGELDPALVNRTMEEEKKSVTEFAKQHPDVLREAGTIKYASIATYSLDRKSPLPIKYTVSIGGSGKPVYAEIDVSRSGGSATFVLRCVTHLEPGRRESFKDVCAQ